MGERRKTALLLAPATVIFVGLFIAPSLFYFIVSFWSVKLYKMRPDFTFASYAKVFDQHLSVLTFTLGLSFAVAVITTLLGFLLAYIIRFKAGRWGLFLLFVALVTLFGGYLMKIYAWRTILGREGVLNSALISLGLIDEPLTFLLYNPGSVIVTLVHFLLPLAVLPIYSSLRGVTTVEIEAAHDLGASSPRILSDIIVPRCQVGLIAAFALSFLVAVGDFLTPQLMGGTVTMIGIVIQSQFGQALNQPLGSATSFVMLGAALLIVAATQVALRQWRPR